MVINTVIILIEVYAIINFETKEWFIITEAVSIYESIKYIRSTRVPLSKHIIQFN